MLDSIKITLKSRFWRKKVVVYADGVIILPDATSYGPRREKTCLRGVANNTGADQPAHPRSLISAFVIRFVESIICKLATGEILIF